jgi:hypothetical protein
MCDFSFVRRSARLPLDPRAAHILSGEVEARHPYFRTGGAPSTESLT